MKPIGSQFSSDSQTEVVRKFSKAKPLAGRLGIHPKTVMRWADAGLIHRFKVSARTVLFDETEVMAFIEKARVA